MIGILLSRRGKLAAAVAMLSVAWPAWLAAHEAGAREWDFDVSLDGHLIGEHRFVLREHAGTPARELTSEARFRVRFLFIDAYRYEHHAREWWHGDCLERLDARTDANGKHTVIAGQRDVGEFRVQSGAVSVVAAECVQTFAYWNPSILNARHLLNPQTGEYEEVEVVPLGRDLIDGQAADKYRLVGRGRAPLEIDLWYSPTQDWLALESRTPEGRRLHYARK